MELIDNVDAVPLNFGRLNISVGFTHEDGKARYCLSYVVHSLIVIAELRKFMYIPKAYFNAVRRREPRQLENATETLLFRRYE